MKKISIIGHVCIDKNEVEGNKYENWGSPAMYINMVLNKFENIESTIISSWGTDFSKYKKDKDFYPKIANKEKTLIYENIAKDGKRIQKAHNREFASELPINSNLQTILNASDALIFAPILPNYSLKFLKGIIENQKHTLKIILPQGYFRNFDHNDTVIFRSFDEWEEVLSLFDYAILSDEDYPDIENLAKIWTKGKKFKIIITLGELGAAIVSNGETEYIKTKSVENIKDTVGSGDVFSASFTYSMLETEDETESIVFANQIAGQMLQYSAKEKEGSVLSINN